MCLGTPQQHEQHRFRQCPRFEEDLLTANMFLDMQFPSSSIDEEGFGYQVWVHPSFWPNEAGHLRRALARRLVRSLGTDAAAHLPKIHSEHVGVRENFVQARMPKRQPCLDAKPVWKLKKNLKCKANVKPARQCRARWTRRRYFVLSTCGKLHHFNHWLLPQGLPVVEPSPLRIVTHVFVLLPTLSATGCHSNGRFAQWSMERSQYSVPGKQLEFNIKKAYL